MTEPAEPEINLFHVIYGTITTQDPDTATTILHDFFCRELVAHAQHAGEAGCEECSNLVRRWVEAVAASHEADARNEEFDTTVFDRMIEKEFIPHMTPDDESQDGF